MTDSSSDNPTIRAASWIKQRIRADCDSPPLFLASAATTFFSAGVRTNPKDQQLNNFSIWDSDIIPFG